MKHHLAKHRNLPVLACGKSWRSSQSSGVVTGLPIHEFMSKPEFQRCKQCVKYLEKIRSSNKKNGVGA